MTRRCTIGHDPSARQMANERIAAGQTIEQIAAALAPLGKSRSATVRYVRRYRANLDRFREMDDLQEALAIQATEQDLQAELMAKRLEALSDAMAIIESRDTSIKEEMLRTDPNVATARPAPPGASDAVIDRIRRDILGLK